MADKQSYRIVTRGENGELRTKTYDSAEDILNLHTQIGVDDCSTNLSLRGLPVFRGLIGPMSNEKNVIRYESPDVFETLTKEWVADQPHKKKRRRKSAAERAAEAAATAEAPATTNATVVPATVVPTDDTSTTTPMTENV